MKIAAIIPAYNEKDSITQVIQAIPRETVQRVLVVDNNSTDGTGEAAKSAGVEVVVEGRQGYGSACLRGIFECREADILVFLDADFSDDPKMIPQLVKPIVDNRADMVIGSRILGEREPGALPIHARFGNILACFLIHKLFGYRFTDLGPLRAIRTEALQRLGMEDPDYGWTVEMQTRAAIHGIRSMEIPVPYRRRIGRSKISGTVSGSYKAGKKILWTIFKLWWKYKRP